MEFTENIISGMSYLFNAQKNDGGIAIADPTNAQSGIWTTAECLEAILSSHYLGLDISAYDKILKMVEFLTNHFQYCEQTNDMGYWEDTAGDRLPVIIAGHVIYSLNFFKNKILNNTNINSVNIEKTQYLFDNIRNKIDLETNAAIKWLLNNQQDDNGWSFTAKKNEKKSEIFCVYYVLKAFKSRGSTSLNDPNINNACIFIKKAITEIINKTQYSETDLPNVLHGYCGLILSGYFKKSDVSFKEEILKYIKQKWKEIDKNTYVNMQNLNFLQIPYIFNMPYIALDTLMVAEEYTFKKQINILAKKYANSQTACGAWKIRKNDNDESTWVTAEAIIILGRIEQQFFDYQNKVSLPQKMKKYEVANFLFSMITAVLLLVISSSMFSVNFESLEKSHIFVILSQFKIFQIITFIIGFISLISSLITIIDFFKKGYPKYIVPL